MVPGISDAVRSPVSTGSPAAGGALAPAAGPSEAQVGALAPAGDCDPADALQIAGLVPMSTVDWPDHLTATVFLQGCPWNCFYCHNRALIPARTPGQVPWSEVTALLDRRRGLLDGVVFTGGEALRQDALADGAVEVHRRGFGVGLHTAGCYPRRLADLLEAGLVDWVGLDIKALPEHYAQVAGVPTGPKAWEALETVVSCGVDYEVRTTVVPGDVTAADAWEVARRVHAAGARTYALQQARSQGTSGDFAVTAPGWDAECQRLAARIESLGWDRFTYRPA